MGFKRKTSAMIATTAVALGSAAVLTPTAQAEGDDGCKAVHIVTVDGTFASSVDKSTEVKPNPSGQYNGGLASTMLARHPEHVSAYNVPYPSAAGAIGAAGGTVGKSGTTYGDSRLQGTKKALEHIKEYKSKCGDSKLLITGYSQGASVAGDVTAALAHGAVEGVGPDDIMGSVLYADPGRSGESQYTGVAEDRKAYIPVPKNFEFQRNGELANPGQRKGTVGWTGQRSYDFKGLEGKVISICNPNDLACSVEDKSLLRDIADTSDKNWKPKNAEAYQAAKSVKTMVDEGKIGTLLGYALNGKISADLTKGNIGKALCRMQSTVKTGKSFDETEKVVLAQAIREAQYMIQLLKSNKGYGKDVPEDVIVNHMINSAGSGISDALPIPKQYKGIAKQIIKLISSGSSKGEIPSETAEKMQKTVDYAAKFPKVHTQYWGDNAFDIEGKKAHEFVKDAVSEGIQNVVNGKTIDVNQGENPKPKDAKAELSDPDRLDDGLGSVIEGKEGEDRLDEYGFPAIDGEFADFNCDGEPDSEVPDATRPGGDDSTGDGSSDSDSVSDDESIPDRPTEDEIREANPDSTDNGYSEVPGSSSEQHMISQSGSSTGDSTVGPKVNTGGAVKSESFFGKVFGLFR